MNRLTLTALAIGLAAAAAAPAHADKFDSSGWTKLGEHTVDGRHDTDVIEVGRDEGRFTALTVVVLDDDLQMVGMKVEFGNGETFTPELRHEFEENSRSRKIDLPGNKRGIKKITLTYGEFGKVNVRDHRDSKRKRPRRQKFAQARVQVWGQQAEEASQGGWDSNGWVALGSKTVTSKRGVAKFNVKNSKAFDKLTLQVTDGDIRMTSVVVTFRKGKKATLQLDQELRGGGTRHVTLEVPSQGRGIKTLEVRYKDRRGGRRGGKESTIELFGQLDGDSDRGDRVDTSGWTMLGEQTVDGKRDRDVIKVGRDEGKFDKVLVVVLDDDVEMNGIVIRTRKDDITPELRHVFKAGSRSREIDLGRRATSIKEIELSYGTTRPRSKARVQIWAR